MAHADENRRFRVHTRDREHHARTLEEASFEAAAMTYIEDLHELGDDPEIRVVVREVDTGHEHCFRVDLYSGATAPCG